MARYSVPNADHFAAYVSGGTAAEKNEPLSSNPFNEGKKMAHNAWIKGYNDAKARIARNAKQAA